MTIDGLKPTDPGVQLLSRAVSGVCGDDLWLIHCGGLPGIQPGAKRLILDIRERPTAGETCIPDCLPEAFGVTQTRGHAPPHSATDAVVWPRPHLGKDFSERCLALATYVLKPGGRLWCAARKAKGGKSLASIMKSLVGNVDVVKRNRGYHLYCSEVMAPDLEGVHARISQTYRVESPLLPAPLMSVPGVFCRTFLDVGTANLIAWLNQVLYHEPAPTHVLDLCAGVGPLGLWALHKWPQAQAWAVESNILAAALIPHNAALAGVDERMHVHLGDGLKAPQPALARLEGQFDMALVNPPTHAPVEAFAALLTPLRTWLRPGAKAFIVVNRAGRLQRILQRSGAEVSIHSIPGFELVTASWPCANIASE